MRLSSIVVVAAVASFGMILPAVAADPGSAPAGVSQDGPGKAKPVDPAEVRRENAVPGASGASQDGGKAKMANPSEVKKENAIPGGK